MSLPLAAVLEGNGGKAKVFILDATKKKVKSIEVRTGRILETGVEVV